MFTNETKLSGFLEDGESVRVSDIIHKAVIEVDESGDYTGNDSSYLNIIKI